MDLKSGDITAKQVFEPQQALWKYLDYRRIKGGGTATPPLFNYSRCLHFHFLFILIIISILIFINDAVQFVVPKYIKHHINRTMVNKLHINKDSHEKF